MAGTAAAFDLSEEGRTPILALRGDWTVDTIASLDAPLRAAAAVLQPGTAVDIGQLGRVDVAGAYLIHQILRAASSLRGEHPVAQRLLEVTRAAAEQPPEGAPPHATLRDFLERVGRAVVDLGDEIVDTLSFVGETLVTMGRLIMRPARIRWVSVVYIAEHAGLNALPIISLLSFFIGLVVAYLGARILGDFGVSVFTVELVAFSVLREFGVVITAVLLAGRTDSAFTAEIGAMKMRQEIDAMRVMGVSPMEALVAPRVIAMLVMTPILAFAASMAGLFGGLLVAWFELDLSPAMFLNRINETVPEQHFWVGMVKSPIFAFVLAVVGCRHGLAVGGDVNSLGKHTTSSVVQAIFLVIMIDAMFALWFLEMDL